ncbi:MAG: pyrroline-5-carboxylate reductase [Pseudomonadota bacterium]
MSHDKSSLADEINTEGLVLLGCVRMGQALLKGWLSAGVAPSAVTVIDPHPAPWLHQLAQNGLILNTLPNQAAVCILAVKPQVIADVLSGQDVADRIALFLSVAAGTTLAALGTLLGASKPIIRTMPNTPALIGQGITAIIGNDVCTPDHLSLSERLMQAVGTTVLLDDEGQIDAVTGLSGSGPAYVFHMIEAMADAGVNEGLAPQMAAKLAIATVSGAGALAAASQDTPSGLRENVTSPDGTTQAGLDVLMNTDTGLRPLIAKTVSAATHFSRELAQS